MNCRLYRQWALTGLLLLGASHANAQVDLSRFDDNAMLSSPEIVECTLETDVTADCARFVVSYKPDSLDIGPFCPETLEDEGGIWAWDGENAGLYRLNHAFFAMLSGLGLDFSDDGEHINIADPGAGQPISDHACLEAEEETTVEMTVLIPVMAQQADAVTDLGTVAKVGLALDAVPIFADAPSVLQTGHLPALDTCGGHIDPGGWYHWHATATDINTVFEHSHVDADCALPQSASALFGYAFDGYAMYGSADIDGSIPDDLDACSGHTRVTAQAEDGEYHYHSTSEFPNLPACLSGIQARNNFVTTADNGIGSANVGPGGPGPGPGPGGGRDDGRLSAVAEALGVSVQSLMQALKEAGAPGPDMNIDKAATALGITADALRAALPERP